MIKIYTHTYIYYIHTFVYVYYIHMLIYIYKNIKYFIYIYIYSIKFLKGKRLHSIISRTE